MADTLSLTGPHAPYPSLSGLVPLVKLEQLLVQAALSGSLATLPVAHDLLGPGGTAHYTESEDNHDTQGNQE